MTVPEILSKKGKDKIIMLTCYDAAFAHILDDAGVDIILVGDSMANVVLGLEHTKDISFKEMFNHTKAVRGSVRNALVVADMPYVSYQRKPDKALYYAKKFIEDAGADAVKLEWFDRCIEITQVLLKNKIPVMGHVGLTPQTAQTSGGFRVQGRTATTAKEMLKHAKALDECGVFSIVLECIPLNLAKLITQSVSAPTLGIGAGKYCDGQVLVLYDIFGLYRMKALKFVRTYADGYTIFKNAAHNFITDVKTGNFPSDGESFHMNQEERSRLKEKDDTSELS